jgi:chromosome segregation ATPase
MTHNVQYLASLH